MAGNPIALDALQLDSWFNSALVMAREKFDRAGLLLKKGRFNDFLRDDLEHLGTWNQNAATDGGVVWKGPSGILQVTHSGLYLGGQYLWAPAASYDTGPAGGGAVYAPLDVSGVYPWFMAAQMRVVSSDATIGEAHIGFGNTLLSDATNYPQRFTMGIAPAVDATHWVFSAQKGAATQRVLSSNTITVGQWTTLAAWRTAAGNYNFQAGNFTGQTGNSIINGTTVSNAVTTDPNTSLGMGKIIRINLDTPATYVIEFGSLMGVQMDGDEAV